MYKKFKYGPEHLAFVKEHAPTLTWSMLTRLFNQHFQTQLSAAAIKRFANRQGIIRSGIFKKGFIPWNKGKKGWRKSIRPGHSIHHYPVGSEMIKPIDNLVLVKVAQPNVWKRRGHLVLEQAGVVIPKGAVVFHINGDSQDDRLENLAVLSREELALISLCRRRYGMSYREMPFDLKITVLLNAKLDHLLKEKKDECCQSTSSRRPA